jgi:predicted ATP-grasp superfamily ATP-dependent carboligase
MRRQWPRILLSEGSSLSSREAITALGLAGHRVELVASDPWCLGRFSRFVRHVRHAPRPGIDPDGYLAAVIEVVERRETDALIPVHEQAYRFAAARERLPAALGVALAEFDAFEQVQSKAAFSRLLGRFDVPQPATEIVPSADAIAGRPYPFFVKTAFGTASNGVWRIGDARHRDNNLLRSPAQGGDIADGLVIQAEVSGPLERTQAVLDHGRLVANHIYRQVVEGPGGGDVRKISVNRPQVRSPVERIGRALARHGGLSFDYILEARTGIPRFLDANPRLVEPMNAWLSGVDLVGALQISLGNARPTPSEGREGTLTRPGLMGLHDAARRRGGRGDIVRELALLASKSGRYRNALEELPPLRGMPGARCPWRSSPRDCWCRRTPELGSSRTRGGCLQPDARGAAPRPARGDRKTSASRHRPR